MLWFFRRDLIMGASRKWIKSLMGTINSKKVSPEGKYKDVSQGRGKGWGLLKSSKKIFTKMERQGEEAEAGEGEKCSGQDMVVTAAMVSAMASTEAAGAAVAAAGTEEAMVRVHLRNGESVYKKDMEEEWAAITIQTAFRCLMARRALRALKGFARLQALVRGHAVRKQTANTLKCMQAMVKIQTRVHANQVRTLHLLKLQQKEEYPHPDSEGRWCDGVGSIQDIQDKARQKQEAVLRRERALAYAYSTQKRASSKQQSEGEKQQEWGWIWLQNCVATNIQTNSNHSMKDSSTLITKKSADHRPTTLSFINNNHNSSSTARRACSNPKQRPHATSLVDTLPLKKRYSLPADARPPVAPATVRKLRMFPKPSSATAVSA